MQTNKRYETFNEILFESYCKTAIDNAVLKESMKKKARSKWQLSLSALTDAVMYALVEKDMEIGHEETYQIFSVRGIDIPVFNSRLAQAISYLLPKDREIILLYYFLGMTDERIASTMSMTTPTVNRRRRAAKQKMRSFLEDAE